MQINISLNEIFCENNALVWKYVCMSVQNIVMSKTREGRGERA